MIVEHTCHHEGSQSRHLQYNINIGRTSNSCCFFQKLTSSTWAPSSTKMPRDFRYALEECLSPTTFHSPSTTTYIMATFHGKWQLMMAPRLAILGLLLLYHTGQGYRCRDRERNDSDQDHGGGHRKDKSTKVCFDCNIRRRSW